MLIQYTNGTTAKVFKGQSFFDSFNWQQMTPGDLVHLTDYHKPDCKREIGIFQGIKDSIVTLRLIPRPYEIILLRTEAETVCQMADQNFWGRFINA